MSLIGRAGYEAKKQIVRDRSSHQDPVKRRERTDGLYRQHGLDYVLNPPRVAHIRTQVDATSYNQKFTQSERGRLANIHRIAASANKDYGDRLYYTIEGATPTDHERIESVEVQSEGDLHSLRRNTRRTHVSVPINRNIRAYSGLPIQPQYNYEQFVRQFLAHN